MRPPSSGGRGNPELALVDLRLPWLRFWKWWPTSPARSDDRIVILTGYGSIATAVEAISWAQTGT